MQKHQANLRQADEPAAPRQQFKNPQAEIERIKQTDRTLAGFARILEIVRDSDFYEIDQGCGYLNRDWLTGHSSRCGSCVGSLLAWFYDTWIDSAGDYFFKRGAVEAASRLGLGFNELEDAVDAARREVGGGRADCSNGPFSGSRWDVDYADVFKELARRHPGK